MLIIGNQDKPYFILRDKHQEKIREKGKEIEVFVFLEQQKEEIIHHASDAHAIAGFPSVFQ
ncbi:hypothetical protein IID24_00150 [Patescibacteria group bacterium]|nr:hypothetical protein [Patescibacteria group bacterium]